MDATLSLTSWIVSTLVLPILLLYLSKFLWKIYWDSTKDENSKLPLPPGNYGWPFIGNTLEYIRMNKTNDYYNEVNLKLEPVYKSHLFGKPMVRVCGEQLVGSLLVKDHSNFKSTWMKTIETLMGPYSLTNSPVELHKDRRRAVMNAFTPDALEEYTSNLRRIIHGEVQRWSKLPLVETYVDMENLAFQAACEVLIGLPVDLLNLKRLYDDFTAGLFTLPLNLPGMPFHKAVKAREGMRQALSPYIQDLMTGSINRHEKIRSSGLEYIMTAHRDQDDTVTESDITDTILELLFAGHKTVASAGTALVMFLGRNPNVAYKIEKELAQNNIQDLVTDFDCKKLSTLTYLGDVIKETLRLSPPVGGIIRKTFKTLEVGGYQIPKGWLVACSINETQKTDDTWPAEDRKKFNPDRWTDLDKESRTRYGFMPFGLGPRICVGRTYADTFLRILAICLVKECDIQLKNPMPRIIRAPVPHPEDNLPTAFIPKH